MIWLGVLTRGQISAYHLAWLQSLISFDPEMAQYVFDVCEAT